MLSELLLDTELEGLKAVGKRTVIDDLIKCGLGSNREGQVNGQSQHNTCKCSDQKIVPWEHVTWVPHLYLWVWWKPSIESAERVNSGSK